MEFVLLDLDLDTILKLEQLRFKVYGINDMDCLETYYANILLNHNCVAYGAFYNGELIGACYVSKAYNSLYIEQLFIAKELQRSGLYLGTKLLQYVLGQKEYIEDYFGCEFNYSLLEDATKGGHFYENIGYRNSGCNMKRKML